jgi:plasmid stability protein
MKNITVSIPDEVYRAARVRAAEEGSSVSALVAGYLHSLSGQDAEFARLEGQQKQIQAEIKGFSARHNIDRDALHERTVR